MTVTCDRYLLLRWFVLTINMRTIYDSNLQQFEKFHRHTLWILLISFSYYAIPRAGLYGIVRLSVTVRSLKMLCLSVQSCFWIQLYNLNHCQRWDIYWRCHKLSKLSFGVNQLLCICDSQLTVSGLERYKIALSKCPK